jgi:hypothetical protein
MSEADLLQPDLGTEHHIRIVRAMITELLKLSDEHGASRLLLGVELTATGIRLMDNHAPKEARDEVMRQVAFAWAESALAAPALEP